MTQKLLIKFALSVARSRNFSELNCYKHMEGLELYNAIDSWATRNKLKSNQKRNLLETFRRIHQFQNGDVNATMILLSFPSEVKDSKEFFTPYSRETKRVLNWYRLTDKGKEIIKDLDIKWNEKEMNHYLFIL